MFVRRLLCRTLYLFHSIVSGTNIHLALSRGVEWFLQNEYGSEGEPLANLLILLTDGEHNDGSIDSSQIADEISQQLKSSNSGRKVAICGLAFGADADFDLLKQVG